MKRILFLLLTVLLLTACGSNEEANNEPVEDVEANKGTTAEKVDIEEPEATVTFEDGVFESDLIKLTIEKAEVIQSPMENKPGLFVTFIIENKTEDVNIVPADMLVNFIVRQEDGTQRHELYNDYHFLDAFGDEDDVEKYNEMVEISNKSLSELLPGKSMEFVDAYTLDNDEYDVVFTAIDPETFEEVGEYRVELSKDESSN